VLDWRQYCHRDETPRSTGTNRNVTVVYNAEWLADSRERSGIDRTDVDVDVLAHIFEAGLVAFVAAEESVRITMVEDAAMTCSYDILIDGERPSDDPNIQDLEYNTEKALERYFQLGTYWDEYHGRVR
jgi:hypothetical protein